MISFIACVVFREVAIVVGFGVIFGILIKELFVLNEVNNRYKENHLKIEKDITAKEKYIEERDWDPRH